MTGPDWRFFNHEDEDDYRRETRCKHCGSEDVAWAAIDNKWVLVGPETGKRHRCEISFDPVDNDTKLP